MTIQLIEQANGKIKDPAGIDPNDELDYELDLTDYLALTTDSVASVTLTGVNCTAYNPTNTTAKVRGWIKEAVLGETATLTFHVVTVAARKFDRTVHIKVKEK